MQKPSLLILAAGMASRYGSMKQTEGFGPHGETIIDYSIYDAIKAGFGKVVFVIREEFAGPFKASFDAKLQGKIETAYVYQALDSFMDQDVPEARQKPWGTAHAILCAQDAIKEPFAVINADDFYGAEAYAKIYHFLEAECTEDRWAVMGYELDKTLSDHGSVSRGVCTIDGNGNLETITERTKIVRDGGKIVFEDAEGRHHLLEDKTPVSMNFWGFHPTLFDLAHAQFKAFLSDHIHEAKSEFLIPTLVDYFIANKLGTVKMIPTSAKWFGVTYKEDAPMVRESLQKLIAQGIYPENLWA